MDIQTILPGHRDVLHDKSFLLRTIAFLQAVVGSVDKLIYGPVVSESAEEMQKAVEKDIDLAGWCKKLAGDNKRTKTSSAIFRFAA